MGCRAPAAIPRSLPVYLVHYDHPDWSASAISSIRASVGIDVDLTVIDNGMASGRPSGAALSGTTRVIFAGRNRGYTGAANLAFRDWMTRYPDGEFCVVGSHDLHVDPASLAALVALAARLPDVGIAAPALVAPEPAAGGYWTGLLARQVPPTGLDELVECDWVSGTCMVLRRECVLAVGPFDERLGSYCEDVDYGLRARDAGWRVVAFPEAHASGLGSSSSAVWGLRAANTVLLNAKRHGSRQALRCLGVFASETLRGFAASALPWRERERRRTSWRWAYARASALLRLVFTPRLVRMIRFPEDAPWRTHRENREEAAGYPDPP